jgi:hypothetical protein
MKKIITSFLALLLVAICAYKSNGQIASCTPTPTGENATIVIPADAQLTVNGNSLPMGSHIIAVFNHNGTLTCAGYATWNGSATAMTVYGAEGGSPGFAVGETYKFWVEMPNGCVATVATASYLSGGIYSHTSTYANDGISGIQTLSATTMQINVTSTNPACAGSSNGTSAITFTTAGLTPYQYAWSNGQTTTTASNLAAGSYSVTVTDASGCTATKSFTLTAPPALNVQATSTAEVNDANNGTATAQPSGGTPPYSYLWNTVPPKTTMTITALNTGSYTVTVTDSKGCTMTATTMVGSVVNCAVSSLSLTVTDNGNGSATASSTGGNPPYSYLWSNGQTMPTATGLGTGSYSVTVTDAIGCTRTKTVSVVSSSQEIAILDNLDILPNPSNGFFSVKLQLSELAQTQVDIYDATGQLVQTSTASLSNSPSFSFDLRDRPAGLYFLKIMVGESYTTRRIVITD